MLAYGFVARALTGPKLSPLALVATRVVDAAPATSAHRYSPGPAKRFAQAIGAVVHASTATLALVRAPACHIAALALVGVVAVFASLEAAFGLCVGCRRLLSRRCASALVAGRTCLRGLRARARAPR